jgi:hypothetical protein
MKALGIVIGGVPMLCCSSGIRNRRFCVSCSSTSSSGPKTVRNFLLLFFVFLL